MRLSNRHAKQPPPHTISLTRADEQRSRPSQLQDGKVAGAGKSVHPTIPISLPSSLSLKHTNHDTERYSDGVRESRASRGRQPNEWNGDRRTRPPIDHTRKTRATQPSWVGKRLPFVRSK